ncbi:MAG: peptidoglycan DD-metalloendopeptidase family protein, partial [Candidatus Eisenbacteria bacterium]|nr:peptidoglycan DD-metalloendopeptidase family protein [Candidatus Eisenbacteria bacterium]
MAARGKDARAGVALVAAIIGLLSTARQVMGIPWPIGNQVTAWPINKTYGDWNGYVFAIDTIPATPTHPEQYLASIRYHTGVDIPADSGTAVRAVFAGYVTGVKPAIGDTGYVTIARTLAGNPSWHYGHVMPCSTLAESTYVSFGDTLGWVAKFGNGTNNHVHFYLEEEVGGLTRSVCNPLDSLAPTPSQDVQFFTRYPNLERHQYKIDYVKDGVETVAVARSFWDSTHQEYLLKDSVDVVVGAITVTTGNSDPGIYGLGYSVSPVDTGGSIPYRNMLVMRGPFEVADSSAYYRTFVDTLAYAADWPLCRYIVTNCGDSIPSATKGISNVREDCWPTKVDTSGSGVATRNEEARFPDGWYDVLLKAWSHSGDTAAVHDTVFVGNFTPIVNRALVRQTRGARDSTIVYDAHWEDGELVVETDEPVRLIQNDVLEAELTFSEGLHDTIQVTLEGPYAGLPFTTVRWDSVEHPRDRWVGRYPLTAWDSIRNVMAGERRLVIWAEDAVTRHALDANPATAAYWDGEAEEWVGYEGDDGLPGQTGGYDRVHRLRIEPWRDVLLHMDVSASVTNPPTGGWAASAYHMADSLLARMKQDHLDSGRADTWRAGVARYFGNTGTNSWAVELLQDLSPNIEASRTALTYFVSPPGTPCSGQGEPLDSVVRYLEGPATHSAPRQVVVFTDGEMNRGAPKAAQERLWVEAATDSTFGCGTYLYAVMPAAKANLSDGMCAAVGRSGGRYLTIPEGDMFAGSPGGVLYDDLVHNSRIYEAQAEGSGTRSTHWFRVDAMTWSLFLLGSWCDWGLQLAQGELFCGGLPKGGQEECGECGGGTAQAGADAHAEDGDGKALDRVAVPGIGDASAGQRSRPQTSGEPSVPDATPDREDDTAKAPPTRLSMTLYDADGVVVPPTGTIGGAIAYWSLSPTSADTGMWRVEVSGETGPYDLRVSGRGGVRIELAGKRLAGVNMVCDVKVRVESEWPVQSPSWSLVDGEGATVAGLSLYDDGTHGDGLSGDGVWGGALAGVAEPGLYRVRMAVVVNGMGIERVTGEGLWVTRPEFVFLTPAAGIDTVEANYLITWADTSEFAAEIGLYYDTDSVGADGTLILEGRAEDADGAGDQYLWNTMSVPEGRYWVYAVIGDGIGSPRTIYSSGSLVVEREEHPGWPVTAGRQILAPITLADLDGDGAEETIVGAGDSLLYCLQHDGTHRAGFPFACAGLITAGAAVGDVDGDGFKELIAVTGDYWGPAYVWVLDDEASVEAGWPVEITQGTRSTPLLVNLVGDASSPPEIVLAGYDSLVHSWTGDGSAVSGWPRKLSGPIQDSSPVGGDIDGDGQNEVVVARAAAWPTGVITALETNGTIKWEKATPSFIYSAPALWDVDNDGKPEVIVATSNPNAMGRLYVLNGENGSDAPEWSGGIEIGYRGSWASPAVGYLTLVDEPRIVVASRRSDLQSEVRAYGRDGTLVWQESVSGSVIKTSPVIADVNGDMATEVLLVTNRRLCVLEGADGDTISAYNK